MMPSPKSPPLPLASFSPDSIPTELKAINRWAPWEARWNERRGKYDKVPAYGLSTAKPEQWRSFDEALAAVNRSPETFAGLGFVLTGATNLVGVDLDRCVTDGILAPWAQEIVDQLGSYTEISPSGQGLRIWCTGQVPRDWTNHDVGIEVYAGHSARFLTVTGLHIPDAPSAVAAPAPDVWETLTGRYAKKRTEAKVIDLKMPDLLDELALPDLQDLGLPWQASDFLVAGKTRGDRSGDLHLSAVSLYSAGLDDAQVLSLLANNPYAMEVATRHWGEARALSYLWREHCMKGKPKAGSRVARAEDFEDVSAKTADDPVPGQPAAPGQPVKRFQFAKGSEFFDPNRAPPKWLIKNLLPERGLGMVFGPSMSGKTFFVLDLAMAIARGVPWRDRKVAQGSVAYICAEGAPGFRLRGRAYVEHHDVDLGGLPFHPLDAAPSLLESKDVKDLVAALKDIHDLKLVVVDTLAQTTPGANENSGEDMGRAMAHCNRIAAATGALVLLVGHTGKDESRGHRGWSGMPAAFDVSIQIERSDEHRAATVAKLKDGQGEGDEFGFSLEQVVLGQDEDGDAITSCVVVPAGALPKAKRKSLAKLNDEQRAVLDLAKQMLELDSELTDDQLCETRKRQRPPGGGVVDNRKRDAKNALIFLKNNGHLLVIDGKVSLP